MLGRRETASGRRTPYRRLAACVPGLLGGGLRHIHVGEVLASLVEREAVDDGGEGLQHLIQLEEEALAGVVAVGIHEESPACQKGDILLGMDAGGGEGDSPAAGGEQGEAVGHPLGKEERLVGPEGGEHGDVEEALPHLLGEAEAGSLRVVAKVSGLDAAEFALRREVREEQAGAVEDERGRLVVPEETARPTALATEPPFQSRRHSGGVVEGGDAELADDLRPVPAGGEEERTGHWREAGMCKEPLPHLAVDLSMLR